MNNKKNKFRISKKGVTLFELLSAGIIAAILLKVGLSVYTDTLQIQSVKQTSDNISYALKRAKYFSRTKGVTTSISFNVDKISILAGGQELTDEARLDGLAGTFSDNITVLSNSCSDLNFNVDGSLVDSSGSGIYSDCEIQIGYSNGISKTLVIRGKTGNVEYK